MIKNVLLISPPAFTFKSSVDINPLPPMGMGYIAAVLKKYGYNVAIIDSLGLGWGTRQVVQNDIIRIGLSDIEISDYIEKIKPDVVGVSNLFSKQFYNALNIAKIVKKTNSNITTVFGGAHPSADPYSVMAHPEIDAVVEGEGEYPFLKYLQFLNDKLSESELESIYIRKNGQVRFFERKSWIDLDDLPWPTYDQMNLDIYFGLNSSHGERRHEKFLPMITSRGCPYKCTFCTAYKVWGKKFRTRDVDDVISEMKFIKKEYGIKEIMFEDDNTTLNVKRAKRLFNKMIEEKLDFEWDTPNGVAAFALDNEVLDVMKQAGCYKVNLAIESGNEEHLKYNIKKPVKLKRVVELVKHCQKINLSVGTFLVFGIPGETEKMVWDSIRFVKNMKIYTPFISIATPYPGSELFNLCKDKGYLKNDFSIDDLYIRSFSISTPELPAKKLKNILKWARAYLIFFYIINHPISATRRVFGKILRMVINK